MQALVYPDGRLVLREQGDFRRAAALLIVVIAPAASIETTPVAIRSRIVSV